MLDKYCTLILATALGVSTLTFWVAGASAATALPIAEEELAPANDGILQIAQNKIDHVIIWNRARHGERCVYRIGGCRHFHQGYYYETPWWTAPLIFGDGPGANTYYGGDYTDDVWSGQHVAWCLNRYRSYNPRNNTWVSYSGKVRQCRSPSPY